MLEALEEISTELDTAAKYLPDFTQYGDKLNDAYYMLEELGGQEAGAMRTLAGLLA